MRSHAEPQNSHLLARIVVGQQDGRSSVGIALSPSTTTLSLSPAFKQPGPSLKTSSCRDRSNARAGPWGISPIIRVGTASSTADSISATSSCCSRRRPTHIHPGLREPCFPKGSHDFRAVSAARRLVWHCLSAMHRATVSPNPLGT